MACECQQEGGDSLPSLLVPGRGTGWCPGSASSRCSCGGACPAPRAPGLAGQRRSSSHWYSSGGSVPSLSTCCLHTGAGLTKQLLLFTQNFCPGSAENEEQLLELPSAPLAQPAHPSSDQDVPRQGYGVGPVLKLCVHEVLTILEMI